MSLPSRKNRRSSLALTALQNSWSWWISNTFPILSPFYRDSAVLVELLGSVETPVVHQGFDVGVIGKAQLLKTLSPRAGPGRNGAIHHHVMDQLQLSLKPHAPNGFPPTNSCCRSYPASSAALQAASIFAWESALRGEGRMLYSVFIFRPVRLTFRSQA